MKYIFSYVVGENIPPHLGVVTASDRTVAEAAVRKFYNLDDKVRVAVASKTDILYNNLKAEVTVNVAATRR